MNPGQEQFYNFIVDRVQDEHKDAVRTLMQDNFKKQDEGTFTFETLTETQNALMTMLKPEAVEEVKGAMAHFASQMK
ncbi:hypothetical protein [Anaerosporobacter sp.]|uniref:hypothetical protein n=1 Tax=Anaerosporobacter sp. TaxID=1872529 RepID=UPI00286ED222|nr:hypothetical protein [Anaerosporobacter sp.]